MRLIMKLMIQIFYFFAFLLVIFTNAEVIINYGTLIENVHDEYGTFGIIMATDKNHFSPERMTILQKLSREMSVRGIGSVVVNFEKLEKTVNFHHRESARSLVVIFLDGITEVHEFRNEIITMDLSYPVWLILFTGDNDRDSCEYCRYPTGNPFNLKFEMEMLVSCCNSSYITKWSPNKINYNDSLSCDGGIEEVYRIESHHKGTLYNHQQHVNIKELRVVIVKDAADIWIKDNELHGYSGEIVTELSRVMNLSISCVIVESAYGRFNPETSMWTGAIGAVMQGRADLGVTQFIMTSERRTVVTFTPSLEVGPSRFYYQNPHHSLIQWTGCLKVFHPNIWIVIVFLLVITPILLTIIQYTRKDNLFEISYRNYLNVWGIFCQQGTSDSLHGGPSRMIYLAILTSSMVVYASYSAVLIRHLSTSSERAPFRNIKDLLDYGSHKLIVVKDSANHQWIETGKDMETQLLRRLLKPRDSLPITLEEAFNQVCTEKVALFQAQGEEYLRENHLPCEILSFEAGGICHAGMILPLDSQYKELVYFHIQRFQRSGVLNRIWRKYFVGYNPAEVSYKSVTLRDVVPILTISIFGCSIASIIFCIEISLNYGRIKMKKMVRLTHTRLKPNFLRR